MTAGNKNPSKYLRCLVMTNQPPGDQIANVRKPPSGLRGWVARAEERLTRKVFPGTQITSHVRGNRVAQDYLLQALLGYSQCMQVCFIVEETQRGNFERWAAHWSRKDDHRPVEVYAVTELFEPGLDKIAPDIWLDFTGQSDSGLRTRDQLSSRVYPAVSLQHGVSYPSALYDLFLRIMLTPSYACDSLICTSIACKKAVANILEKISTSFNGQFGAKIKFAGRLDLIPLCVDTDAFQPRDKCQMRKQLDIPKDSVVLLYIGYLSLYKADFAPLLPMIRRLVDDNPNINLQFMIAGTGPESYGNSLLTLIQDLNLRKNVTLLRGVSDVLKQQLLGAADVFVAPCDSLHESFGLTPVEAMACGLPQVVANWDGYRDTVSNGETGFLVPTCWGPCDQELRGTGDIFGWMYDHTLLSQAVSLDVVYMQECLQTLIRQPELRAGMSERSRARAVAEFSYPKVACLYDQLLAELSAIARTQEVYPKTRRFDQTAYFNFFGHFASRELTDDCVIRAITNNSLPVSKLTALAQTELGIPVFDQALLGQLIQDLSTAKEGSEGKSVRHLISQTKNETRSADTVRRHILFLLKHGKLDIISPRSPLDTKPRWSPWMQE